MQTVKGKIYHERGCYSPCFNVPSKEWMDKVVVVLRKVGVELEYGGYTG